MPEYDSKGRRILPSQLGRLRTKLSEQELAGQIDYIDNKDFLEKVVTYRKRVIKAQKEELPIPPITEEIGELFLTLARNLSNRPCFISYPYKEDMVLDGVENCLKCINNYRVGDEDPKNTFSYFTQVVYWAFLRRIKKEKKSLYTRFKVAEAVLIEEDPLITQSLTYSMPYMMDYVHNFETSNDEKTKAKKTRKKLRESEGVSDLAQDIINEMCAEEDDSE